MGVAELDAILREAVEKKGWINDAEEKAERRKAIRVAKRLLLRGFSAEQVAEDTELPLNTIIKLKTETLNEY